MPYLYILFSKDLDRYYIGSTHGELPDGIRCHNSNHKGYTGKASDWIVVHSESFENYALAHARELQLKSWKSRVLLERLIKH